MNYRDARREHGIKASSAEFAHHDQVGKQDYHLAEAADSPDAFDES
ncbi:MAG: hypothetical protein ACI80N_004209, partial [Gammaproteobacteria bacterium]